MKLTPSALFLAASLASSSALGAETKLPEKSASSTVENVLKTPSLEQILKGISCKIDPKSIEHEKAWHERLRNYV